MSRRKPPVVDIELIAARLDELGWPVMLDSRQIRHTLDKANARTQRVPKALAAVGYEKHWNPDSQSGVFYIRTKPKADGPGVSVTIYRRVKPPPPLARQEH
jgi:hypothetical protein